MTINQTSLLKFFAAIFSILVAVVTLTFLPLWVYFSMNVIYLMFYYKKNDMLFSVGFVAICLCISAPFYLYIVMENLIDGKKWNSDI